MAILEMKKLRLLAARTCKEELLKELIRCGCVEITEADGELREEGLDALVTRESPELMGLKAQHTSLLNAINVLNRCAPQKGGFLSAKPELEDSALLDDNGLQETGAVAEQILAKEDSVKRLAAEESRQQAVLESLKPWLALDMPLDTTATERCAVMAGSMPARIPLSDAQAMVSAADEEAELYLVSEDKTQRYLLLICMKEQLAALQEALRPAGFAPVNFAGLSGTAAGCMVKTENELKRLAEQKAAATAAIAAMGGEMAALKLAADKTEVKIRFAEAEGKLCGTESTVVLRGWMPAEREAELTAIFDRYECAWETETPAEEEYPDVPVKLKNNKFTNALNMVTEMYSLPAYGSLDPNPLMAPFFILFYGLMMADMGYGILMVLAAVIGLKKLKPRGGSLAFCQLLLYAGISTFVMGALTGGFFGDALVKIGELTGQPKGWGELPALFTPLKDTMYVLIGSMIIGFVHLNTGMVINVVKKLRRGQKADAFFEEGALWITFIGAALYVFKIGNIAGVPVVLVLGLLLVFYGGSRNATGFGKVTSIFGTLYNTATGWFGDILSYARIMALMLAGSVIAQVFNTIGAIANSLIVFIPIFLVGHALNFGLNLLGCYVHDLRLQCLEFFGKFYEDGGRAFEPLNLQTKFYNVKEN